MSSTKIHKFPISTIKKSTSLRVNRSTSVGKLGFIGKFLGIDYALLSNREWNQTQKHKKQPWSNVECFAFDGATVRFASLETSSHAANHTITPPPSYEGIPNCTNDKNRSPFHGEKTPDDNMISWKEIVPNLQKRFFMVSSRYFAFATND